MTAFAKIIAMSCYGLVGLLCVIAAIAASSTGRGKRDVPVWLALAVFCLVLVAFRYSGGEEALRQTLRALARDGGWYQARAQWQAPLVALIVVLGAGGAVLAGLGWRRVRGSQTRQLRFLGGAAMLALLPLYAARLVSYHPVDVLLHAGPVPLGWLAEAGLLALAGSSAVLYRRNARRYPLEAAARG